MASNLELTELEQRVLDYVKKHPGREEGVITTWFMSSYKPRITRAALASLISNSFISADENLRYHAVGGAL